MKKLIFAILLLFSSASYAQEVTTSYPMTVGWNFFFSYITTIDPNTAYNPYFGLNYNNVYLTAGPILRLGGQTNDIGSIHFDTPIPGFFISCQLHSKDPDWIFFFEYNFIYYQCSYQTEYEFENGAIDELQGYQTSVENLIGVGWRIKIRKRILISPSFGFGYESYINEVYGSYKDYETNVSGIFKLSLGYLLK